MIIWFSENPQIIPVWMHGLASRKRFIRRISYTTHMENSCCRDADFLSLNILWHDDRCLRLLCRSGVLFRILLSSYLLVIQRPWGGILLRISKALNPRILVLLGLGQWFRGTNGDPVVMERSDVFYHLFFSDLLVDFNSFLNLIIMTSYISSYHYCFSR